MAEGSLSLQMGILIGANAEPSWDEGGSPPLPNYPTT